MDSYDLLEVNNSLTTYYSFPNVFNDEQIEQIKGFTKKYNLVEGNIGGTVDLSYRVSNICWFPVNDETRFVYDTITRLAKIANSRMWLFHITNIKDKIQLSEYKADPSGKNGHYDWHMDFGRDQYSTRKLSMSMQLTDENEYEGGDLEFMINRSHVKAPRKKGTVIFFPSYLTHRVTNVTSGTRHSLVTWFHGPPFI